MDKPVPATMIEAVRHFADPNVAHDFFVSVRWPSGVACPLACGSVKVSYMPKRRRWYCNDCKGQFTAKLGTIFEDSPIGFEKWLPAIWLIASNRNGISSCELARALGVTQKTGWFMLHRIRAAMKDDGSIDPLTGEVEADEAWIGGELQYSRKARKTQRQGFKVNAFTPKTAVFGVVHAVKHAPGSFRNSRSVRSFRSSLALFTTTLRCIRTSPVCIRNLTSGSYSTTPSTMRSSMSTATSI